MLKGIVRTVFNTVLPSHGMHSLEIKRSEQITTALQKERMASSFENFCLREAGSVNGI